MPTVRLICSICFPASFTESTTLIGGGFKAAITSAVPDSKEQTTTPNYTPVIVSCIVGTLLLVAIGLVVRYYLKRRRRGRLERGRLERGSSQLSRISSKTAPTIASFVAGFSTEAGHGYQEVPNPSIPYTYYVPPAALVRSITPSGLTVSTSSLSLPRSLYVSDSTSCCRFNY